MNFFLFFLFSIFLSCFGQACERAPSIYQSRVTKIPGDNGYEIRINENPQKYVPGNIYTMYLMATTNFNHVNRFTRFIVNVESTSSKADAPQNVGNFQLYSDNMAKFNEDCINTISETNSQPKTEVFFMWSAPPPGSGCVTFRAMVFEDAEHWYADDGKLTRTFCEQTEKDQKFDDDDCCTCDEAKYSLIFEGIWSNKTHPRDYPFSLWLTHFSDVIGASHEKNFTFWGEGQIASEGFRSLAEWGSVRMMETELRAKSKFLRTLIKASGLWYPHVNTNTTTTFKVDRTHHLVSLASMFGPSPDWVVGVNGLNLCLKNCTWIENLTVDLFPYDAGTDSGISYMSPNAETNPRERMYRITTTYPEDPRAPFYDPAKKEIYPLAKLYLTREKVIPRNCDEKILSAQIDVSENTEDTTRAECAVTEYTEWSACSVSCGKGLRMRTREYTLPEKAKMFNCNRQLISKEMCVAAIAECEGGQEKQDSEEEIESLDSTSGVCSTYPWSPWSSCSATCGEGYKSRTRRFVDRMGRKKCPHISIMEKEPCSSAPCRPDQLDITDPQCPTTDWSDWSPCSASCGKGIKIRTRLLLVAPEKQQHCSTRVELLQQYPCEDVPTCEMDMNIAKVVCMQDSDPGPCQGYFNRWFFDASQLICKPFIFGGCRGNRNNFLTAEECSKACQIVVDAVNGNIPQPGFPKSTQVNSYNHPVDCVVSDWSDWSRCTTSCGTGIKERFRKIFKNPENGGKRCPANLFKRKYCYGPPCPN